MTRIEPFGTVLTTTGQTDTLTMLPATITHDIWLRQLFSAQAARDGGVVRRQVRDVERILGRKAFKRELHRCGHRAIENSGDILRRA